MASCHGAQWRAPDRCHGRPGVWRRRPRHRACSASESPPRHLCSSSSMPATRWTKSGSSAPQAARARALVVAGMAAAIRWGLLSGRGGWTRKGAAAGFGLAPARPMRRCTPCCCSLVRLLPTAHKNHYKTQCMLQTKVLQLLRLGDPGLERRRWLQQHAPGGCIPPSRCLLGLPIRQAG